MTDGIPEKRKSVAEEEAPAKKLRLDSNATPASESTSTVSTEGTSSPSKKSEDEDQKSGETAKKAENDHKSSGNDSVPATNASTVPSTQSVSSKPVFGAASTFGSASIFEKMKNKVNVFESSSEKPETKASEPSGSATPSFGSFGGSFGGNSGSFGGNSGSFGGGSFGSNFFGGGGSFGAGSKFSNALQKASQKKSFLDEPKDETPGKAESPSVSAQQYKQVELTEKKVETGEENEKSVYSAVAKLFELDLSNISEGWKERGRGPLHVNRSLESPKDARLVMRSNGLLRVILNYKITPTTALIKGLEASLSPGKFLRVTSVSAEGKPVQYMLKFSNQDIRDELFDKVAQLKDELKKVSETGNEKSSKQEPKVQPPQATGFKFIPDPYEKSESATTGNLQRSNTEVDAEKQ